MEDTKKKITRAAIRLLQTTDLVPFYELGDAIAEIRGLASALDVWTATARGLVDLDAAEVSAEGLEKLEEWAFRWGAVLGMDSRTVKETILGWFNA